MEKSSRESIAFKIKLHDQITKPPNYKMSDNMVKKLIHYFNSPKPSDKMERMKAIYDMVDQVIHEMSEMAVCRKGCAWCCKIPLEIMPIELEYIELYTGSKRNKELKPVNHPVDYCPLLDHETATCTVYEYRPFNCRAFLVYDSPDYCAQGGDIMHWTNGGPENGYGNNGLLLLAQDMIEKQMNRRLEENMRDELEAMIHDIRSYF